LADKGITFLEYSLPFKPILQAFYSEFKNGGCDMQGRISDYLLDRINRII